MKKAFALLSLFIAIISFGQIENNHWCFTYQDQLSFGGSSPTPGTSANNNISSDHYGYTSASVSDKFGNLLFYSDGVRVWDRNGTIMPGGSNIGGGVNGSSWAEQAVVIVPKPGSETIYYIFTACRLTDDPFPLPNHSGFHYSIVDISQNGGNGAVVLNTVTLKDESGQPIDFDHATGNGMRVFETSMTTAFNNTNDKIWVTVFARFHEGGVVKRVAYSYLVGPAGIGLNNDPDGTSPMPNAHSTLPVYCTFASGVCFDWNAASIKISPNGTYLANETQGFFDLYLFNNSTGSVQYHHRIFTDFAMTMPGDGIEFSPNSQLVYFSSFSCGLCQHGKGGGDGGGADYKDYVRIRQALVNPNKGDTPVIIGQFEVPPRDRDAFMITPIPSAHPWGDIQLAPDGNIYVCSLDPGVPWSNGALGVIDQPDVPGTGCMYSNAAVVLPNAHAGSLPQWVHKVPTVIPPTGPWVWMHGDNTVNQPGVYGTQGIPAPGNKPGYRYDANGWTDANGNFWLFGGYGGPVNTSDVYNDLWKYDVSTNQWTWVSGDNIVNQPGNYGTQGVPSGTNKPGGRANAATWVDASNNLWLLGGNGLCSTPVTQGHLNDLWKYNISTNQWTWVNGDNAINQVGIYGTQGTPAPGNKPGSRARATAWTDNSGNLWMWGGYGYSAQYPTQLNDMWKYTISTGQWTWLKGDNHPLNNPSPYYGVYGTQGAEAGTNMPGGRMWPVSWSDNNYLWFFGGTGWMENSVGDGNDLWRYNINTNNWTWMGGAKITYQYGNYGVKGVPSATNQPGSRKWGVGWKDNVTGNFWLFGGHGKGMPLSTSAGLNDLWEYNKTTNEWTWINGQDAPPNGTVYGTLGVGSPTTNPGIRFFEVSWIDQSNNLWLFGGLGETPNNGFRNDLWKYTGNCAGPNCRGGMRMQTQSPVPLAPVNALRVAVNPNPASTTLNFSIFKNDKRSFSFYSMTMTDQTGNIVLRNDKLTGNRIDVSILKTGVYYITVMNEKGEKASTIFFKL